MTTMTAPAHHSENDLFGHYMDFANPTPFQEVWSEQYFDKAFNTLTIKSLRTNDAHVDAVRNCYANRFRSYHGPDHGAFVGQNYLPKPLRDLYSSKKAERVKAWATIAGIFHDSVYKNVDADWNSRNENGEKDYKGAWRPEVAVAKAIGKFAEYKVHEENDKPVFTTFLTKEGKENSRTQMVANIFGMTDKGMIHNQGGNEFDSALYAVKFMERLEREEKIHFMPIDYIAITAAIAATVPFKTATNIDPKEEGKEIADMPQDGHMGQIAKRVAAEIEKINGRKGNNAWEETNEIMPMAVHIANRDIAPFILTDNAAQMVKGGREVKKEERPELREIEDDIQALARAATRTSSAPLLYEWFSKEAYEPNAVVPAENVPHFYLPRDEHGEIEAEATAYPPKEVYDKAVINVRENTQLTSLFFKAHETAITLAASMATMRDPENPHAKVTDIVNSPLWHKDAQPEGRQLNVREEKVYSILNGEGQVQVDSLTTERSPIAAFILGVIGEEGINHLSKKITEIRNSTDDPNPFAKIENAETLISEVKSVLKENNFGTLVTEMHRVARHNSDTPWMEKLKGMARIKQYIHQPEQAQVPTR